MVSGERWGPGSVVVQSLAVWTPPLTSPTVCRAGCFTSLDLSSLLGRTGAMTVPTPLGRGEDAWNSEWYYVMENGRNKVEAGAPSCPLFTEPWWREAGGAQGGAVAVVSRPIPVGSPGKAPSHLGK